MGVTRLLDLRCNCSGFFIFFPAALWFECVHIRRIEGKKVTHSLTPFTPLHFVPLHSVPLRFAPLRSTLLRFAHGLIRVLESGDVRTRATLDFRQIETTVACVHAVWDYL